MEPITTELRELMTNTVDGFDLHRPLVECDRETFERLCDNIDAVHEGLERENGRLKCELDRVLGELEEMHKTDEISDNTSESMHNAEHESKVGCTAEEWDYWESTHIELPKDKDGVPIHVGDELAGYGYPNGGAYCKAIVGEWGILAGEQECNYQRWLLWSADDVRHYHTPTVEDVLSEACKAYHSLMVEGMSDFAHDMPAPSEIIAEYAAKLRLAGDAE